MRGDRDWPGLAGGEPPERVWLTWPGRGGANPRWDDATEPSSSSSSLSSSSPFSSVSSFPLTFPILTLTRMPPWSRIITHNWHSERRKRGAWECSGEWKRLGLWVIYEQCHWSNAGEGRILLPSGGERFVFTEKERLEEKISLALGPNKIMLLV